MAERIGDGKVPFPPGVSASPSPWPGGGYLHRPGEVLVAPEAMDAVRDHLRLMRADSGEEEGLDDVGLVRVTVDADVPTLVRQVRTVADGPPPLIAPNHVFHPFGP